LNQIQAISFDREDESDETQFKKHGETDILPQASYSKPKMINNDTFPGFSTKKKRECIGALSIRFLLTANHLSIKKKGNPSPTWRDFLANPAFAIQTPFQLFSGFGGHFSQCF
jgi:hypothetical protein